MELLKKLINDEIKTYSRKNLVQARSFSEMLAKTVENYQKRGIQLAEMIEALINLAKEINLLMQITRIYKNYSQFTENRPSDFGSALAPGIYFWKVTSLMPGSEGKAQSGTRAGVWVMVFLLMSYECFGPGPSAPVEDEYTGWY